MNEFKNLYDLANGIFAAGRIGEVISSAHINETRGMDNSNPISVFTRILEILAEYSPEKQRNILGQTANRGRLYMEVFNKLNQTLSTYREKSIIDRNDIVNTLAILQPVLSSREKVLIDKIIKLNEVFS